MNRKLAIFATIIVFAGALLLWQTPAILRALPSRYVAAMPEPIQALGVREHVGMLPTAAPQVDTSQLLRTAAPTATDEPLPPPAVTVPPTFTPEIQAEDTPTLVPSATPTATSPPSPTPTIIAAPPQARLQNVVHHFQDWNNCGPATLAMALSYFGRFDTQYDIAQATKPDPEDRNVSPYEIAGYVNNQTPYRAINRINGNLDMLRSLISLGAPVMVEIGLYPPGEYAWMDWFGHYLLVVAYDDASQNFWVYDSWLGTGEAPGENNSAQGRRVAYAEMDEIWQEFNRSYVTLFSPEDEGAVHDIIGPAMDDSVMWQGAFEHVQDELSNDQENAFLWFNLGSVYNALGEYENAASAFDRARQIGLPWRMLWYQFGPYEAYLQTERYEDILALADATLLNRPYFEESFYYKGQALAAMGSTEEARVFLERAVRFNPNYQPAVDALAQIEQASTDSCTSC